MQEGGLPTAPVPVAKNPDARPVGEAEAADVHRVRRGMFAELALRTAVEPAAAVAPEMFDRDDPAVEMAKRCELNHARLEQMKPRGDRAGRHKLARRIADIVWNEAHSVVVRAL